MPPKVRITKEMIVDAAFEIVRTEGAESINARTVSKKLGCSTQPVMYHFAKMEDLKRAVYAKLDWYHTEYLLNVRDGQDGIMLGIGLNYIRFAIEEPRLFRFLFQSGYAVEHSLLEMIDSEQLVPILSAMRQEMGLDEQPVKEIFLTLALFVHGYASIIANHSLDYDEKVAAKHLERAYRGAWLAVREQSEESGETT